MAPLAPEVEQIATDIGVKPLVDRVRLLASQHEGVAGTSLEEIYLRQQITEVVLTSALDVDEVVGEIEFERAQISEVRDALSGVRDKKVNLLSLANIVAGTGTGIIGTAMQFWDNTAMAGDAVGVGGGAGGVFLSILGLRQKGGRQMLGVAPNMLAPLFGRFTELRSVYPEDVWRYLNRPPVNDPRIHVSWREQLISEWVRFGRIGPADAPGSQKKIDVLTSSIGQHKKLSIDVLADRSAMLLDLRARVSLMNRDLRDLLKSIAIPSPH